MLRRFRAETYNKGRNATLGPIVLFGSRHVLATGKIKKLDATALDIQSCCSIPLPGRERRGDALEGDLLTET